MVLLLISVVLQGYVLYVWLTLRPIVTQTVWNSVFLGMLSVTIYRFTELLAPDSAWGHYSLACLNSLFFAWAARHARNQMTAQRRAADALEVIIRAKVEPEPTSFAVELARVLNEIRTKLEFYEAQAAEHGLSKYEEVPRTKK